MEFHAIALINEREIMITFFNNYFLGYIIAAAFILSISILIYYPFAMRHQVRKLLPEQKAILSDISSPLYLVLAIIFILLVTILILTLLLILDWAIMHFYGQHGAIWDY